MIRNNINSTILAATIFLSLFSSFAFAPNKEELSPLPPDVLSEMTAIAVESDTALEYPREEFKKAIKQNADVFGRILAYAALREENISLCEDLDYTEECRNTAEDLMRLKDLVEGRCDQMPPAFKPICLNLNNCDNLTGWQKDICQGYDQGDLSLMQKGQSHPDFCKEVRNNQDCEVWDEADAREVLGIYQGFKSHGSKESCEKYVSGLRGRYTYLCEVMFSKTALNDVLDGIAEDLAYFHLSSEHKDKRLCEKIRNNVLKAACLSSQIKEYFENHW